MPSKSNRNPITRSTTPGKQTAKKPTPLGTDMALTMSRTERGPLSLTYWDLWFSLVANADFGASLDQLATHLKGRDRRIRILDRDSLERMLAHLRDLQKRLSGAGIGVGEVISKAGNLVKSESRRAWARVLDQPPRQQEWSDAMLHLPRQWRYAQALYGRWPQFPVSPGLYAEKMRSRFKVDGFYTENQSFTVARRLDRFVERAQKLLAAARHAEAQALLRAFMAVVLDVIEIADDSFGCIGESFDQGFRAYLEIPLEKAGIEDQLFFSDLLDFLIWEDYGFTDKAVEGYFRNLSLSQGDLCIEFLRPQIEELQADDLDYQSEQALRLVGQVVVEQDRFEQFTELARQMGSRQWKRIVTLVDRAVKNRKLKLAADVFEAALTPGDQFDFLSKKYEQLKRGKWDPDPRK